MQIARLVLLSATMAVVMACSAEPTTPVATIVEDAGIRASGDGQVTISVGRDRAPAVRSLAKPPRAVPIDFTATRQRLDLMEADEFVRSDPALRARVAAAREMVEAAESGDGVRIGRAIQAFVAATGRSEELAAIRSSITRVATPRTKTIYFAGGRQILRIDHPGYMNGAIRSHASVETCDYPPGTPEEEMAAECVEGYDANYDPQPALDSVAYLTAQEEAYAAVVANSGGGDGGGGGEGGPYYLRAFNPLLPLTCEGPNADHNVAIGAFVTAAVSTVFWSVRRNVVRAAQSLAASGAALVHIYTTGAHLIDCKNGEEQ